MNKLFKLLIFLVILWALSSISAMILDKTDALEHSEGKIVVIPVQGALSLDGDSSFLTMTSAATRIIEQIEEANNDPTVKGIVLYINSPGGTVMGSKKLADAVKKTKKPVVAVISEYGTSGAYWVASQSDYIFADALSMVGSIGVMGSYLEFSGLLQEFNVSYQRLITGQYKDILSPYKSLTSEEEAVMMDRLQAIHNYMVKEIANGRGMSEEDVQNLSNGLFYLGMDAVNLKLVDQIGDKEDAIKKAKELAGMENGKVKEYKKESALVHCCIKGS